MPGSARMLVPRTAAAVVTLVLAFGATACGEDDSGGAAPAPGGAAAKDLGFPAFATKNTTRVGGGDPVADAAAVALATFPSTSASTRPRAVALASTGRWEEALAAASLMAPPLGAPTLLAGSDIPEATSKALDALRPVGASKLRSASIIRVGRVPVPHGRRALRLSGDTPAQVAAAIDELRAKLTGRRSRNVLVVGEDEPAHGMAAAAWAARSGDPILIAGRGALPRATREALRRHPKGTRVYVVGPATGVSSRAVRALSRLPRVSRVRRITGATPTETSIAFARYSDAGFGWDINDPGHGFTVARDSRPLDAVAAAPLAASGMFAPLLVTSQADRLPDPLRGFFLDLQPGYRDDPVRAAYNHVWLLGDLKAISLAQQGSIDRLAEVKKIEIAPEPAPARRAPKPPRRRPNSDVPTDDEVQQTLEDLLDASPDRGGKADR